MANQTTQMEVPAYAVEFLQDACSKAQRHLKDISQVRGKMAAIEQEARFLNEAADCMTVTKKESYPYSVLAREIFEAWGDISEALLYVDNCLKDAQKAGQKLNVCKMENILRLVNESLRYATSNLMVARRSYKEMKEKFDCNL